MNKKAVSARTTVVFMVLGLALTVFMLLFIKAQISEASTEVVTREQCGATVDRMSRFNEFNIPISDRDLNCPTLRLTIDDKDDKENNKKNNKIMADAMYNCAKQFRRGEVRLFTNNGVHCNVCYIFDIQTDKSIEGFHKYLSEKTVPEASGLTYYEYMQGFKSEDSENVVGEVGIKAFTDNYEGVELTSGKQYATIFVYARGDENFRKVWNHITAQTPAGQVGLAGAGLSFLTFGGGGAVAGLGAAAIWTGPVGWAVFGIGLAVGAGVAYTFEALTLHFSPSDPPEWMSFFVFRNWDRDTARDLLVDDIGCDYFS